MLKDVLQVWNNTKFLNNKGKDILGRSIYSLNSPGSIFSNDLSKKDINDRVVAEFRFFDKFYWKERRNAFINIFVMG